MIASLRANPIVLRLLLRGFFLGSGLFRRSLISRRFYGSGNDDIRPRLCGLGLAGFYLLHYPPSYFAYIKIFKIFHRTVQSPGQPPSAL